MAIKNKWVKFDSMCGLVIIIPQLTWDVLLNKYKFLVLDREVKLSGKNGKDALLQSCSK